MITTYITIYYYILLYTTKYVTIYYCIYYICMYVYIYTYIYIYIYIYIYDIMLQYMQNPWFNVIWSNHLISFLVGKYINHQIKIMLWYALLWRYFDS